MTHIDPLSDTNLADWFKNYEDREEQAILGGLMIEYMIQTVYDTDWAGFTPQEREVIMRFLNDFRVYAKNR